MKDYLDQILGLTGDEPPLTAEDIAAAIPQAFRGWYGEFLLAGGDRAATIRASHLSTGGWLTDHCQVSVHTRPDGLLLCVKEYAEGSAPTAVRVGRITWRQAEDVLRAVAEPEQLELEVT